MKKQAKEKREVHKCDQEKCKYQCFSRSALSRHKNKTHGIKPYKYQSRANRAGDQASQWRNVADRLREISEDDKLSEEKKVLEARIAIEDVDTSELESLKEEMENWRDNMSGTSLENTGKYSEVEEAADSLGSIDVEGKSIDSPDDIESVADELESAADELESVNFPGMY